MERPFSCCRQGLDNIFTVKTILLYNMIIAVKNVRDLMMSWEANIPKQQATLNSYIVRQVKKS